MLDSGRSTGHQRERRGKGKLAGMWGKKVHFVLLDTGAGHELAALVEKAIWGRALVWLHGNYLKLQKNPSPFPAWHCECHNFRVMGPVHSNFLDGGYWMRSNDYWAGRLGVQTCLGPSLHHRREKPIPDKPRLIISCVMRCYFLCRTFTILEKLFPNQSFLPQCVCSPSPSPPFPLNHRPHPREKIWFGSMCTQNGGRQ